MNCTLFSSRHSRGCVIRCAPKWKRHGFSFGVGHPATAGGKNSNPPKNSDGCRQTKSGRRWRRVLPLQIASGDVLHNVMISLFGITSDDRHLSWNSRLTEYKTENCSDEWLERLFRARRDLSCWSFLGWRIYFDSFYFIWISLIKHKLKWIYEFLLGPSVNQATTGRIKVVIKSSKE